MSPSWFAPPGVYYAKTIDKTGKPPLCHYRHPRPRRLAAEYETDSNDVMWVRIDRTRKLPMTVLLRAIGYGTDNEITDLLGTEEHLQATLERDTTKSVEAGLLEIYKKLRPGEPPDSRQRQYPDQRSVVRSQEIRSGQGRPL